MERDEKRFYGIYAISNMARGAARDPCASEASFRDATARRAEMEVQCQWRSSFADCSATCGQGWFKAWSDRRRDDAPSQSFGATSAQGGLQLGEDVGDVGLVEG